MPITLSESAAKEIKSIIKDQSLPEDKTRLRHAMAQTSLREVRFRFDFEGTRVIS